MRLVVACLLLVLPGSVALASSYQRTDGTIVDPIQTFETYRRGPGPAHSYSGPDLEPFADLAGIRLTEILNYLDPQDYREYAAVLLDADLRFANLSGADLEWAFLEGANISGANLTDGRFIYTDFRDVTAVGANFSGAALSDANLEGGNFRFADFSGATLDAAYIDGADFSGANFTNASIVATSGPGGAFYDAHTDFTGADIDSLYGWTLIPEPSTALLIGVGLIGLAAKRRRARP